MFVQRDASGKIIGAFAAPQPGFAEEEVADSDPTLFVFPNPPEAQNVLPQDLVAQFGADDAAKIQAAVSGNVQFWLLWSALQAQTEPMVITNARFRTGWAALIQVLGQPRMTQIATALNLKLT